MPIKANKKATEPRQNQTVSTLRGVKRVARNGTQNWTGPKVRTRAGFAVTARIRDGVVEVMDPTNDMKWTEYPEEGKNLDPSWSPTPPKT